MSVLRQNARVAVVGSGISGLSFAFYLSKLRPDVSVTVYESSTRVGGYINSKHTEQGVLFEKGPRTLRGASAGTLLIIDTMLKMGKQELLMGVPKNSISSKRYVLSSNKTKPLLPLPHNFASFVHFLNDPLVKGMIGGVLREPFRRGKPNPYDTESVAQFMERRFGKWAENLVSAVCHGVFSGSSEELGVDSFLPLLAAAERDHGSVIRGILMRSKKSSTEQDQLLNKYNAVFGQEVEFRLLKNYLRDFPVLAFGGGLSSLPSVIYETLQSKTNVKFRFNRTVEQVEVKENQVVVDGEPYDHLRSTINTHRLAEVLDNENVNSLLRDVKYSSVALVNVYVPGFNALKDTPGFGYLVPLPHENEDKLLGVIFDSCNESAATKLFGANTLVNLKLKNKVTPIPTVLKEPGHTKLTLMFGGHFYDSGFPSKDALLASVQRVLLRDLSLDLSAHEHQLELEHIRGGIPQFNVGYQKLKSEVASRIVEEYGGLISFGGMCFGDGIGVPDCYLNGFKSALSMSGTFAN